MSEHNQNITALFPAKKAPQTNSYLMSQPLPTSISTTPFIPSAIIYCEGQFGKIDGKTANGLVRYSQNYRILAIIDSQQVGLDAGEILGDTPNGIPVVASIEEAIRITGDTPDYFIFGLAPSSGMLSSTEKTIILDAMACKMNIVNGLHEFFHDDPQLLAASKKHQVRILDVRRPKHKKDLQTFNGDIHRVACPRIAVMGTDCAIGKRTTATILTDVLRAQGLNVVMIATGQTGIIQGAPYGVALDAVPSQFCAGELEAVIVKAYEKEQPDLILVEGQGALSHPAFSTSSFILRGSCPTGVILQHAPKRHTRVDFPTMPMPSVSHEIALIEMFADTAVIGLTLNHEDMSAEEVSTAIQYYSTLLGIPVTDALSQPTAQLLQIVLSAFPALEDKIITANL